MKKFSILLLAFFTMATSYGQKVLTEGSVKMEITEVSSDDEQMAMGLEMMKGSVTTLFFKGDKHVTSMDMMGGMVTMSTHVDEKEETFNLLMDAMGQKMWVYGPLEESRNTPEAKLAAEAKIEEIEGDVKEILGYKCKGVKITVPGQEEMPVIAYVTDQINTKANLIQGMQGLKLDGFPLMFTIKNPMMTMTMTATELTESVDVKMLEMKTEGYTKMTFEEFQKQMGGMGSGLGF